MRKHREKLIYVAIIILFIPLLLNFYSTFTQVDSTLANEFFTPVSLQIESESDQSNNEYRSHEWKQKYNTHKVYTGSFNQPIEKNETLWFYTENLQVTFIINDEIVFTNVVQNASSKILHVNEKIWHQFSTPAISSQDKVEVRVLSPYEENLDAITTFMDSFHIGDGSNLYQAMVRQMNAWFIVAIIVCVAGWIYMLEGLIYIATKVHEGRRITSAGFYFLCGGLWSLTDCLYPYLSLLFPSNFLPTMLELAGPLLLPIAITCLVQYHIQDKHANTWMKATIIITLLLSITTFFVSCMNFLSIPQLDILLNLCNVLPVLLTIICVCQELRYHRNHPFYLLLLALSPVFLTIITNVCNAIWGFFPGQISMHYGFTVSAAFMITQLSIFAKNEVETKDQIITMKNELTESRIAIMLSQIQPHFLYNALGSIGDLCTKNPVQAEEAITEFALFLRGNIDSLNSPNLILFERELEHTSYYANLEKLRFGKRLEVKIDTPITQFLLPCLTLQPIVENAIRHGVTQKKHGGIVHIRTSEDEASYIIEVEDDGTGFQNEEVTKDRRSHIGIENVRNRLQVQCGGSLEIYSQENKGTIVTIRIPKEENKSYENHSC